MNLAGHGLTIGVEESQQSQASLFNSGNDLTNSMELFSQPYSASSHSSISQHSQTHNINTHTGTVASIVTCIYINDATCICSWLGAQNSQEDGRGVQNVWPDTFSRKPQVLYHHQQLCLSYLDGVQQQL